MMFAASVARHEPLSLLERLEHLHELHEAAIVSEGTAQDAFASEVQRIRLEEPEVFSAFVASVRELWAMAGEQEDQKTAELLGIEIPPPPNGYVRSLEEAERLVLFSAGLV